MLSFSAICSLCNASIQICRHAEQEQEEEEEWEINKLDLHNLLKMYKRFRWLRAKHTHTSGPWYCSAGYHNSQATGQVWFNIMSGVSWLLQIIDDWINVCILAWVQDESSKYLGDLQEEKRWKSLWVILSLASISKKLYFLSYWQNHLPFPVLFWHINRHKKRRKIKSEE